MTTILTHKTRETEVLLANDADGTLFDNLVCPRGNRLPNGIKPGAVEIDVFRKMASVPGVENFIVTGRNFGELDKGIDEFGFQELRLPWASVNTGIDVYERRNGELAFDERFHRTVKEQVTEFGWDKTWLMGLLAHVSDSEIHLTDDSETMDASSLKVQWTVNNLDRMDELSRDLADAVRQKCHRAAVVIGSIDTAKNKGFLDVMPLYRFDNPNDPDSDQGVTGKVIAIEYVRRRLGLPMDRVAYAGDSNNDRTALVHGYYGTIVENAKDRVRREIIEAARLAGTASRLSAPVGPWLSFPNSMCLRGVIRGAIEHAKLFREDIVFDVANKHSRA